VHSSSVQDVWHDAESRSAFIEYLSEQLHLHTPDDWYHVKETDFVSRGGRYHDDIILSLCHELISAIIRGLIHHYNGSLYKLLSAQYPNVVWQPWRFTFHLSASLLQRHRKLLDSFALNHINTFEDWYAITRDALSATLRTALNEYYSMLHLHLDNFAVCITVS
jgi:hypothetical protein